MKYDFDNILIIAIIIILVRERVSIRMLPYELANWWWTEISSEDMTSDDDILFSYLYSATVHMMFMSFYEMDVIIEMELNWMASWVDWLFGLVWLGLIWFSIGLWYMP